MCKKITTILFFILSISIGYAQVPEKLSYQAVIRDNTNKLVANQDVGVQISILKEGTPNTTVYVETHTILTNANGLISYKIGEGTVVSGSIANIDWADGTYSIKTETDPNGGTNYSISGTSSLTSVPYALQAKTATNLGAQASASLNPSKCNCVAYIIPFIPYNSSSISLNISVTNTPANWFGSSAPTVGDAEISAQAIDESGIVYNLGIIGTAGVGKVTRIGTLILDALENQGALPTLGASSRFSIRIQLSNPEYAFVTASYVIFRGSSSSETVSVDVQCIRF